jgi:hypothetical protein
MRRPPVLAALPALVLVLVAGCGGDPKPKSLPSPTASPSPSASASATPPVMPAAARAKSRGGSEAGVQFFIDALNYSGKVGDTTSLRSGFAATCTRCEALADSIDETYAAGGHYEGGDWRNSRLKFYAIRNGVAFIDATVDYDAQEWVKTKDATPSNFPASTNHLHAFQVTWAPTRGWRVGALDPDT